MQKEGASLSTGMWSFMWFDSSTQMEMLRKTIDIESLENFQKVSGMEFVLIKLQVSVV